MSTVFPLFIFLIPTLSYIFSDDTIRAFLRLLPVRSIRKMMKISDTMARRSREIIAEKKSAVEGGDEGLMHRIAEGKDVMSILCTWPVRVNNSANGFISQCARI